MPEIIDENRPDKQMNPLNDSKLTSEILFQGHPSHLTGFKGYFIGVLIFLFLIFLIVSGILQKLDIRVKIYIYLTIVVLALLVFLYTYLSIRCMRYTIDTDRIEVERGIFSKKYDNLDLFRIKDLKLERSFLQRIAGVGNLTIFSTDVDTNKLELKGIRQSKEIYDIMKKEVIKSDQKRGVIHIES